MLAPVRPRLVIRVTRRILLAAVCALPAHAAAYGTLWPKDGMHGYLGWYEPLVAALSLTAIAGLLLRLSRPRGPRESARAARSPSRRSDGGSSHRCSDRGDRGVGLVYLLAQESLERRSSPRAPRRLGTFAPGQRLALFAALGSAAFVLALVTRLAAAAVRVVLRRAPAPVEGSVSSCWSVVVGELHRSSPLALGPALRAPPALSPA